MRRARGVGNDAPGSAARRGIALPVVLLVMTALGLLSALALFDALQATRGARLAGEEARAHAAALAGVAALLTPPNIAWLCLQPPSAPLRSNLSVEGGGRVELTWWSLGRGRVRAEVAGFGGNGGRSRRLAMLLADSLPADSLTPGCPLAVGLRPESPSWLRVHPDG